MASLWKLLLPLSTALSTRNPQFKTLNGWMATTL